MLSLHNAVLQLAPILSQAAQAANDFGQQTSPGGSLFNEYTAAVARQLLLIGVLVTVFLGGGLLVLNLGMLSKRREDRVGGPNPSDVGILKNTIWPDSPVDENFLPAEDEDQTDSGEQGDTDRKSA